MCTCTNISVTNELSDFVKIQRFTTFPINYKIQLTSLFLRNLLWAYLLIYIGQPGPAPRIMRCGCPPTSLVGVTVQAPLHFLEAVGVRTPRTAPALPTPAIKNPASQR